MISSTSATFMLKKLIGLTSSLFYGFAIGEIDSDWPLAVSNIVE